MHPLKQTYTVRLAITIKCIKNPAGNNMIFLSIYSISFCLISNNDTTMYISHTVDFCSWHILRASYVIHFSRFICYRCFLLTDLRFLLSFHIPKTSFFNDGQHSWRMLRFCTSHAFVVYVTGGICTILSQWATSFPVRSNHYRMRIKSNSQESSRLQDSQCKFVRCWFVLISSMSRVCIAMSRRPTWAISHDHQCPCGKLQ